MTAKKAAAQQAVYLFGLRYFGKKTACWAAAFLAFMPAYILLSAGGYIDVGLTLFLFMSFFGLWLYAQAPKGSPGLGRLLTLAGFLAGGAIGCKYTGGIPLLIGSAILLKETFSQPWKSIARVQVIYSGAALLVFSPWLIKNFYYVGNPVFPFLCRWSIS